MSLARRLGTAVRLGGLPALWLAFALLMVRDHLADPFDPSLTGTATYGHNHEGALRDGLAMSAVELAIAYALLRPWSYRRSWGRALAALALCLPWTLFSLIMLMHAGGIMALHFLWLLCVVVALVVAAIWSAVAAALGQRPGDPAG